MENEKDLVLRVLEKEGENMNEYNDSSSSEALEVYMKKLNRLPLLTTEEEKALTKEIDSKIANLIELLLEEKQGLKALGQIGRFRKARLKTIFSKVLLEDFEDNEECLEEAIGRFRDLLALKISGKRPRALKPMAVKLRFAHKDLYKMLSKVKGRENEISNLKYGLERAKKKLIECNLRLVFKRAKKFIGRGMPLEDLIQEGNIGLMRATESYDIARGWKFSTYATYWLDQAFGRALANKGNLIRLPAYMVERINRVNRIKREFLQEQGRNPSDEELAEVCGESLESIKQVNDMITLKVAELDAPVTSDTGESGQTLGEFIADDKTMTPLEIISEKEFHDKVRMALARLSPKEEKIIRMRFGIGEKAPFTLEEIGGIFNVTRERIRQIEAQTLQKLAKTRKGISLRKYWRIR